MKFISVNHMPKWVDVIEAFKVGENSLLNEAVEYIVELLIKNDDIDIYKCTTSSPELLIGIDRGDLVLELFNSRYWLDDVKKVFIDSYDRNISSLRSSKEDVLKLAERMTEDTPKGAQAIIKRIETLIPYKDSDFLGLDEIELLNNINSRYEKVSNISEKTNGNGHSTDLLILLNLTVKEFYYPRKNIDAKKEEVIRWMQSKAKELNIELSDHMASSIFTIITPPDHNPKKRVKPHITIIDAA